MAKRNKKRGEKLGEIVGRRRPVLGTAFIFVGLILLLSMLGYRAGQDVFFKEYFETLLYSTESSGANVCGRFGATFCLLSFTTIGFAAWMVPVYLIWMGLLCYQRRAAAFSKSLIAGVLGGVFLLSVLSAIFQASLYGNSEHTPLYLSGWGGNVGSAVFDSLLNPVLDIFGSAMLVGILYAFCLVVVFVDSPLEAAHELKNIAKKSPPLLWRVAKIAWIMLSFIPKMLLARRRSGGKSEAPDLLVPPRRPAAKTSKAADISVDAEIIDIPETKNGIQKPESGGFADTTQNSGLDEVFESILKGDSSVAPISDFSDRFGDDDDLEPQAETPSDSESAEPAGEAAFEGGLKAADNAGRGASRDREGFRVETFKSEKYVPAVQKKRGDYVFPTIDILSKPPDSESVEHEDYEQRIREIVERIGDFGIKVVPVKASPGPVITRYEVRPAPGVRVNKIAVLEDDIAIGIKAPKVRVIAPIPGAGTVGIEVPNKHRQSVCLRDIIESKEWNESSAKIPIALGKDVTGVPIVLDLTKMPHALIAGSTGSGKSVCMNSIIASLVYKMTPEDLRFIMVDPKVVEMQVYNSLPHMLVPVVTNPKKVPGALKWLIDEMMRRYKIFSAVNVKNIAGFNAKIIKDKEEAKEAAELDVQMNASLTPEERNAALEAGEEASGEGDGEIEIPDKKLPYIVCIIDELADLMMVAGKEVEAYIARLTQWARAAGIHLRVATQRPSTDVITGLIKSNLPTRIAFKSASNVDSRTILDCKGAETLIGMGDMLFISAGSAELVRAQGAYTSDDEVVAIVDALKVNGEPEFASDVQAQIDSSVEDELDDGEDSGGDYDDSMTAKAISIIRANKKASTSLLQRKLRIGYGRAARIIDELEEKGIIGPDDGSGKREIFLD